MAYTKTDWQDRAVQFPNRYDKSGESGAQVTLVANPGLVTQAGTPINATKLNNMETGIETAHQALWYAATTNVGNAYSATLSPAPTAYVAGMTVRLKINANSTGAVTINLNALGAKSVKNSIGVAASELKLDAIYTMTYNGTDFILQGDGSGVTKSIQRGIANPSTGTSNTVAITAVDITKSIVRVDYLADSAGSLKDMFAAQITNSTTLTLLSGGTLAETHEVFWEVTEFFNVKSKQSGSIASAGITTTIPVTAVNTSKALLFITAITAQNIGGASAYLFHGMITNATTLTIKGSGTMTYYWQLIEFN